jgi:glucan phosphoethanolaminetransferase (alkaline phosphatase superfamily)
MTAAPPLRWSWRAILVFWWLLLVVIQQAERLFLLPEAWRLEAPSGGLLAMTLWIGLRADLIMATFGMILAMVVGGLAGLAVTLVTHWREEATPASVWHRRSLFGAALLVALVLLTILIVDMGYYGYNQQHLDFVFFEYVDDLLTQSSAPADAENSPSTTSQASRQTSAELNEGGKWGPRVVMFLLVQGLAVALLWLVFRLIVQPVLLPWEEAFPRQANGVLAVALIVGAFGLHPQGPYAIRIAPISSTAYYMLAQNPVLYAGEALRATIGSRLSRVPPPALDSLPLEEAVTLAREAVAPGADFPSAKYPLAHRSAGGTSLRFGRPVNVLLIFIEGLDRRYLGRTMQGVRVTPFLDQFRGESVYFQHFFSNGTQTARGMFASFCSYYPRQGTAAMKTRYAQEYLCLPNLLRKHGYRTEMVVGQHRDLNRLHLFLSRNGLHQLFDENDFPSGAERMGLGMTDGALFDMLRGRIEHLQQARKPFFLSTLTLSTHHPFAVPQASPDVRALAAEPDGYVAALRYVDLEFEKFFSDLQRRGLLKDTVMFVLGDHGRHEPVGRTDQEKQIGHFLSPLMVWVDGSLRSPSNFKPRTVGTIASQVDLAPTILAMNGLMPPVSPFLGRDVGCALASDCPEPGTAFLSSAYDDAIGLADRDGILLYSFRTELLSQADLNLEGPPVVQVDKDRDKTGRYRRMLALYVAANTLLEQGRVWSWKEPGVAR